MLALCQKICKPTLHFIIIMQFDIHQILMSFIIGSVCGVIAVKMAKKRGRDPTAWFFAGFFFGLFALLFLYFLSAQEKDVLEGKMLEVKKTVTFPVKGKMWYYLSEDQKQIGPLDYAALKELWENGNVSTDTYVWCEGMTDWETVEGCRLFTSSPS